MNTFFFVTDLMFSSIKEVLTSIFSWVAIVLGAVALIFCLVIAINVATKGVSKKFFDDNMKFIVATIILEAISCLFSPDLKIVKCNAFIMIICVLVIMFKSTSKKVTVAAPVKTTRAPRKRSTTKTVKKKRVK